MIRTQPVLHLTSLAAAVVVAIALATVVTAPTITTAKAITGREIGHEDGRDHPFSQKKLDEIGRSYYHGYVEGCMSVKGNTRAACEDATDHTGD
jgi:hypothetical protein